MILILVGLVPSQMMSLDNIVIVPDTANVCRTLRIGDIP